MQAVQGDLLPCVQLHPLRALACDRPARLVCPRTPCMSRIPRGTKGEEHDHHRSHSGFDCFCHNHCDASAEFSLLSPCRCRPLAAQQTSFARSTSALLAPMFVHHCDGGNPSGFLSPARPVVPGPFRGESRRPCGLWLADMLFSVSVVRAGGLEPPRDKARRIFLPATAFAAARKRLGSGLSLHLAPPMRRVGAARLVSTPSRHRAWLGIAI